jgi:hypothetical protein
MKKLPRFTFLLYWIGHLRGVSMLQFYTVQFNLYDKNNYSTHITQLLVNYFGFGTIPSSGKDVIYKKGIY